MSIDGYWTHLVKKHHGTDKTGRIKKHVIDDEKLLTEIRQSASLWRTYWHDHSDGGKRGNATKARLEQIEEEEFGIQDVLDWGVHLK